MLRNIQVIGHVGQPAASRGHAEEYIGHRSLIGQVTASRGQAADISVAV